MTTRATQGIPLLSGPPPPPPPPEASACRKCGKEFTMIFHRQRKCMHCGYAYCSSCSDYQALTPRRGPVHGYDLATVCGFCIEFLNVTALGRTQLKALPLAKLRRYTEAYDIQVKDPIDKSDFVDAIWAVRTPQGCLPAAKEAYYRKNSVPSHNPSSSSGSGSSPPSAATRARNLFSRGTSNTPNNPSSTSPPTHNTSSRTSTHTHTSFPRPDLDPNRQRQPQETPYRTYTPRSAASNAARTRTASAPLNPGTARPTGGQPRMPRPTSSYGSRFPPRTPSTTNTSSSSAPAPAPPPMSTLATLPRSSLSALSVGTLKKILWDARVRIPPGVVEKDELVERVWGVVEEERRKCNEDNDVDTGDEEDAMDDVEEGDVDEEVVVEMAEPESEAHPGVAREQQGYHDSTASGGVQANEVDGTHNVEDDVEMNEEHPAALETDAGLSSSRQTTPQPFASQSPTSSPSLQPPISPSHPAPKPKPRSRPAQPADTMHSGLCVVCQDEEASIAVVDCGHLAMCRTCSDLVLASSRECPLCRTRIITEARLLRIFKT
ncbi:hypothetical protein BS17DRAFT_777684 [Gyrodon lividus]|nr:hypothetical protein BS17DRAFT_777684 [Gyrodon lividus]